MSATGLKAIDRGLERTHIWLNELIEYLAWDDHDRERAYHGMRAVFHALRDRLTVNECAQLAAQIPMLLRGMFYEGWHPANKPVMERTKAQFLQHVKAAFEHDDSVDPEEITRGVFAVIRERVSAGEVEDILHILPPEICELWS